MLPCRAMGFLLMLFWVVSDVHLDNVPPEDMDMTVEDSTVSPMGEITPPLVMRHKTEAIVVNNNEVIMIDDNNVNYISENYHFVLILFYVKWCRFSVGMLPTFDQLVIELFKVVPEPRKFAITKLDCDLHETVCDNYGIVKFPTIKIMRHGSIEKLEYRKERNVEALVKYVKEELVDPTILVEAEEEAVQVQTGTRRIIGYLSKRRPFEEEIFRTAATHFKKLCVFILHLKDSDDPPRIEFQPDSKSPDDESAEMPLDQHNASMTFTYLRDWANYKCVPYVREITFENAEEITEEGLPLFILFYRPEEDLELMKTFKRVITKHFVEDILGRKINFLTANGMIFEHPLVHLGKKFSDLPLICIDSLKHMFSYPYKSNEDLVNLEKLHRYLQDFYSERLHMKYHGLGDDDHKDSEIKMSTVSPINRQPDQSPPGTQDPGDEEEDGDKIVKESDFIKLYPSDKRYTLKRPIRDEL